MNFGLSYPNFGFSDPGDLVELAIAAEASGWHGFFIWDHIVIMDRMPVQDPWVVLGAIARSTDRIQFGPMVVAVPRHRPWVVARQSVSLDRLSKGRFVLGVGIGFPPEPEFGTFGEPQSDRIRADMLDEGLEIIQGVWGGEPFEYRGDHYTVNPTSFAPKPLQQPRIPIWVACMLPHRRPLRRAARFDGVFPIRVDMADVGPDDVLETRAYIEECRSATGAYDFVIGGPPRSDAEFAALAEAGVTWYLAGPPMEGESLAISLAWIERGPEAYRA
jgi:alkanesulfonate monooxygenase SsuD/methylene tetrahydromethanopterin reductase-like flavin-dependent oxidoreductase (luciferase family)